MFGEVDDLARFFSQAVRQKTWVMRRCILFERQFCFLLRTLRDKLGRVSFIVQIRSPVRPKLSPLSLEKVLGHFQETSLMNTILPLG